MKYLILIAMCNIFSLGSCFSPNQIKNNIYVYGTEEFELKVKEMNLSLEEAVTLASDYFFTTRDIHKYSFVLRPDGNKYVFTLHIIYDNNFIFTTVYHNSKLLKYNMTGIWVNGITGEVQYIQTKKWTKVDLSHFPIKSYDKIIGKE